MTEPWEDEDGEGIFWEADPDEEPLLSDEEYKQATGQDLTWAESVEMTEQVVEISTIVMEQGTKINMGPWPCRTAWIFNGRVFPCKGYVDEGEPHLHLVLGSAEETP